MFVNPWRLDGRSHFNIVVARRLLAILLIWRLLSYRWSQLSEWPGFVFENSLGEKLPEFFLLLIPWLGEIAAATVGMLLLVLAGKWWKWAAVAAAAGLIILASFHQCVDNQGKRLLVPGFFLILFAIFAPRRTTTDACPPRPSENPLCWILLALALTYVLCVVHRLKGGHYLEWTSAENLLRTIRWEAAVNLGIDETFGAPVLDRVPLIAAALAHGTLIAEVGLLVAVICRWRITLPVLALIGMHLGILASMHLFFIGSIGLLCMFLDWERLFAFLRLRPMTVERMPHPENLIEPVILYDGVCGLCNRFVAWVLKHDHRAKFRFAPLQGPTAARYIGALAAEPDEWSISLVDQKKLWHSSDAAIRIISGVGGVWAPAILLLGVPRPIREGCYRWIAKRRYALFGKTNVCQLPPPEMAGRFLP